MITAVREPAVAGYFYPRSPEALSREISGYTAQAGEKLSALACVVPHAGYMYSGHVAGAVYGRLQLPPRFVILCPNHTGYGRPLAVMTEGAWQTPLGLAPIDRELGHALRLACPLLEEDEVAHRGEHAIEVQLPFLQAALPEFTFVPIAIGTARYERSEEHTSELQSHVNLVCRLLLEKKKIEPINSPPHAILATAA